MAEERKVQGNGIVHGSKLDTEISFALGELNRDQLERTALEFGDVEFDELTSDDELRSRVIEAARERGGIIIFDNDGHPQRFGTASMADADETRALALRAQALALLEQAKAIDGLQPFVVTHSHATGTSSYLAWAKSEPTEAQAASVLDAEFEPDRDEFLAIESNITLDELTGVSVSSRVVEQEEPIEYGSPSPGM